jgi:hypothetical protein
MRSRELITLLGGAVASWPLTASAEQAAMSIIGFLNGSSLRDSDYRVSALRRGARDSFPESRDLAQRAPFRDGPFLHLAKAYRSQPAFFCLALERPAFFGAR